MKTPFRVVLVGCGSISGNWLGPAKTMVDLQIVGLVDQVEENARRRAAEFHLESAVVGTDLRQVLRQTRPDLVFDCTVPEAHAGVASGHGEVSAGMAIGILRHRWVKRRWPRDRGSRRASRWAARWPHARNSIQR